MKRLIPFALLCSSLLALGGCATTPKQPPSFYELGQFSEIPLNQHSYRLSFKAQYDLSYGDAEEIMLVKAAKTTIEHGFRYFKVLNDPSNVQHKPRREVIYSSPPIYYGGYYGRRYGGFYGPAWGMQFPYYYQESEPVEVSYSIECYKGDQAMPADAFDALLIFKNLAPKYGLIKPLTQPTASPNN